MFFRSQCLNILCLPMNKDLSVASKQLLLFLRSEIPSVQHSASARSCSNKETGSWSLIQKYLWPIHFANPGLKILAFHLIKLRENVYVFYCRMLVGRKTSTGRMWQVVTAVVITCMLVSSLPHNASVPVWGKTTLSEPRKPGLGMLLCGFICLQSPPYYL